MSTLFINQNRASRRISFCYSSMAESSISDTTVDLPPDAAFEIMSRADLKTLARCRLLSRQYRDLTYKAAFMRLHGRRTETISGYFVQSLRNGIHYSSDFFSSSVADEVIKLPLDFLPVSNVTILASSSQNGLLLCRGCNYPRNVNQVLYVCKPTTRQWTRIPGPKGNSCGGGDSFGLAVLGSNPVRFKIVRVRKKTSNPSRRYISYQIQVFDSRKRAWSYPGSVFRPNEFPVSTPASAAGALHWLTSENRVLSLDAENENWEVTCIPRNLSRADQNLELVESIGKLGLMRIDRETDSVELWVRDGRRKRWWKKETVDMGGVREAHGGGCCARGFYGSDVGVISSFSTLIFRDLHSCKDEIVTIGDHTTPEKLFFFQSDFQTAIFDHEEESRRRMRRRSRRRRGSTNFLKSSYVRG